MRRHVLRGGLGLAAGLTVLGAFAADASAAACPTTNILYIKGSSAVEPFIKALGKRLAGTLTLAYIKGGSCTGVTALTAGDVLTGTADTYDAAGAKASCDVPTGQKADIGVSDVFATSCDGVTTVPTDVGDFQGPVQAMNFVVPNASSQTTFSSQAGYFVFGFGTDSGVDPWTDKAFQLCRNASSGTQQMLARAIGVTAPSWKFCKDEGGSGTLLTDLAASASPEKAIGIISSDFVDQNRTKIKALAFQAIGVGADKVDQQNAFWPDSKATAFDKINVRDGHYWNWGPLHFFTKVDGTKKPTNADAGKFLGLFDGTTTTIGAVTVSKTDVFDLEVAASVVPQCAMQVKRTAEMGDLSVSEPAEPCGCYYEQKSGGLFSASCKTCTGDTECGTGKCRFGFCEAR